MATRGVGSFSSFTDLESLERFLGTDTEISVKSTQSYLPKCHLKSSIFPWLAQRSKSVAEEPHYSYASRIWSSLHNGESLEINFKLIPVELRFLFLCVNNWNSEGYKKTRNGCGKHYLVKLLDLAFQCLKIEDYTILFSTTNDSTTDWCGYPSKTSSSAFDQLHGKLHGLA